MFATKARSVDLHSDVVRFDTIGTDRLPLCIHPDGEDVSLVEWSRGKLDMLRGRLHESGGILFRGFGLATAEDFHAVVSVLGGEQLDYTERSSPRSRVQGRIFTSTDHPADQEINFHNELAYSGHWPMEIFFFGLLRSLADGDLLLLSHATGRGWRDADCRQSPGPCRTR